MSFTSLMTRQPIAFDPERGAEVLDRFAAQSPEVRGLLEGTAGCSPYLKSSIEREADWLEGALSGDPHAAMQAVMADVAALTLAELKPGLRIAKRRAALWIALCDLSGVWPLETVTRWLTEFADHCVDVSLKRLVEAEINRGKLPGLSADDVDTAGGMVALAMGKQGAYELNYSSDIDLICLFDESRIDPDAYHDVRAGFIRITRRMAGLMSESTGDGYVFRTDLRLRPDPSVTPVCLSMDAAERYYESVGRTWERAAHIKARPCAGDLTAGWAYLDRLRPFVWRKHLDFAAIQDAHDMRLKIRDHKGLHGAIKIEGHNMKLGAGGIREIEFFTQTRQLIAGGRDPDLRLHETVPGLAKLAEKGWVPTGVAETLSADYREHREIEHRLQMVNDAQTHSMPTSAEGVERIARFCGVSDTAEFRDRLQSRLERVDELTEGFFAPGGEAAPEAEPAVPAGLEAVVERWPTYPALRSPRAVEIFARLKPEILRRLDRAAKPDEALQALDGFLSGLPAGVQLFSLFEANPHLIDLIIDIAATAPELALYLSRNASVLDAVIGGSFFAPWPATGVLQADLARKLAETDDYERKLDSTRRWAKEWHFRIGVHLLRGLITADEASGQYADLAQAVVAALYPPVVEQFAAKHGDPPGQGAVVLGMGSLGAGRLTPRSDLDLIVIYDPAGVDYSEGRRPLAARTYYARLTQALVTALTAPMAEGRLYEVDMRLRPSGRQGPVATSIDAFRNYQRDEAWTWEHLALTRCRVVAGAEALGQEVEAFRRQLLTEKGDRQTIVQAIAEMRTRLAEAKPAKGQWDGKLGAGRGQDIELIASGAALMAGDPATQVGAQLRAGVANGWLDAGDADALAAAYGLFRRVQTAAKLLSDKPLRPEELGEGGASFLHRCTGHESNAQLATALEAAAKSAAGIVDRALAQAKDKG